MKTIKVRYLRDVTPINKITVGDWIDLRAGATVNIRKGEYCAIPLGVVMELPKGYEAIVAPRSSTFFKYHIILANSVGIIDESYKGDDDEWHFLAYAMEDTRIEKDERICQFRIVRHQPRLRFKSVRFLGNKSRGGIGSTGRT